MSDSVRGYCEHVLGGTLRSGSDEAVILSNGIRGPRFCRNISGRKFGRLTALKRFSDGEGRSYWTCLCSCGMASIVLKDSLLSGHTTSCGCYHAERIKKHGKYGTRVYKSWQGIKTRCFKPNTANYKNYGGRGIGICLRWYMSFENFYADMGDPPTSKHTIDRINNDGHYTPNNCRWATAKEQAQNRRPVRRIK